jgi:hypothetical protein
MTRTLVQSRTFKATPNATRRRKIKPSVLLSKAEPQPRWTNVEGLQNRFALSCGPRAGAFKSAGCG